MYVCPSLLGPVRSSRRLQTQLLRIPELINRSRMSSQKTLSTTTTSTSKNTTDQREGAEIVYGAEDCKRHSLELLDELGLPRGVMPLKDLVECGRVPATGFVWMRQKAPSEHLFEKTKTLVSYAVEVTSYVGRRKMTKMTGVKSKQVLFWVPIVEMSIDDPNSGKINFKSSIGVGKSFPVTAFMTEEEEVKYLEDKKKENN